jgi:iron complex outermembrane receptor protein
MTIKNILAAILVLVIQIPNTANALIGPIIISLKPTNIASNYFNEVDTSAPFSSEIYTESDINNSNSSNIYDFLTQNTSLNVAPANGNRFTQKIAARGYGLTDGYQNIVITLNGIRLNNIDTSAQELNVIDINNIEKIEIIKGSGSVIYGDSAMAGAIHIYTKKNTETQLLTAVGNYGLEQSAMSFGLNQEKFGLNLSLDNLKHGGYSVMDPSGNKDKGEQTNKNIGIVFNIYNGTELQLGYSRNNLNNRYPNYLTYSQFKENPAQNSTGRKYTFREAKSTTSSFKVKSQLNDSLLLSFHTSKIIKDSQNTYYYSSSPTKNDYDYRSNDLLMTYENSNLKIDSGITTFNGSRKGLSDTTTKENTGLFTQFQYNQNDTIFTAGVRNESVDYAYKPNSGSHKSGSHHLNAFDIGFNTNLNYSTSVFSNINLAFQAPLIDRFFKWDGSFNGFMNPSKSRTINVGLNHLTDKTKTKATFFRSNLTDEMYYYSDGYKNTNLDKTHKYGLELQNKYIVNPKWSTNVNYAYTVAKIDEENEASGAYNGKTLPMTSKHNVSASAIYSINDNANLMLTQKYRSKAFSEEDFANSKSQRQKTYSSTNINFSYRANDNLEFKFDIENLFKNSYGTWLRDDVIYPSNSTRNIKAELSYKF